MNMRAPNKETLEEIGRACMATVSKQKPLTDKWSFYFNQS